MGWQPTSPWSKPVPKKTVVPSRTADSYARPTYTPKPAPIDPRRLPTTVYPKTYPGMGGHIPTSPQDQAIQGLDWIYGNDPNYNPTATRSMDTANLNARWNEVKNGWQWGPDAVPTSPFQPATMNGSGGGGGGGGGGAGATGLDQATLDWILAQLGLAKPKALTANNLDLPDPAQYFGAFNTQPYDVARTGVTQGIQGIRDRGATAIGNARDLLGSYQNPYATGLLSTTPDLQQQMDPMMQANGVNPSAVGYTNNEGIQADQAMRNAMQMYAATDQRRQQDNLTANTGDLNTLNQNLDLEQLLLSLGIDMGQTKGQGAWDQMVKQAGYDAATTEASQNWQRGNTVGDTNVANNNQFNQGLISTLLQIIGAKAPTTTLPASMAGTFA